MAKIVIKNNYPELIEIQLDRKLFHMHNGSEMIVESTNSMVELSVTSWGLLKKYSKSFQVEDGIQIEIVRWKEKVRKIMGASFFLIFALVYAYYILINEMKSGQIYIIGLSLITIIISLLTWFKEIEIKQVNQNG